MTKIKFRDIIKKALVVASILMLTAEALLAVPAKPGVRSVTQADGTKINILLKGDEFFRYRTTESGYPITKGEDDYYYYAKYASDGKMQRTDQRVSVEGRMQSPPSGVTHQSVVSAAQSASTVQRAAASEVVTRSSVNSFPSEGSIRSAVILVEYFDVKFSVSDPNQAFWNQLNQEGYSVEGATGSAKDYFTANSRGKFDGQFDVYGPYTLSNKRSYYGENDSSGNDNRPSQMIWDAVALADADGVDFSQYDYDNDGYIDNVFVYYAGHNEAEGGSEDSVWPHKWVVASKPEYDGKMLYVYACTSELRGDNGSTIAGIGTFCHEFSHVFGLADHYDTNGDTNGLSYGLGTYDIMSYGSYNNNGNTPPLHNGLELEMIGWVTPTVIESSQDITIEPINTGEVYKILTDVDDEYFLIENHNTSSSVWENYISASGLFITHVDRSSDYLVQWYNNSPNGDTSHECFRYIISGGASALTISNEVSIPYPYRNNTEWSSSSTPAAKSWSGADIEFNITNIVKLTNGNVTFSVTGSNLSIECSEETIYVGDAFTLTAVASDGVQHEISWETSDSVVTSVANGDTLECTFTQAGSATFSASYMLDSKNKIQTSITLTAVEFQGARGKVEDLTSSDLSPISDASISFYPLVRTSTAGVDSFTRAVTVSYQAQSNEVGEYSVVLNSGYYEVEVEASAYQPLFEMIYIDQGLNTIDFGMSSYSSSVDEISVDASQNSATIIWNPQQYSSFEVVISSGGQTILSAVSYECIATIDGLSPSTEYSVTIKGKTDDGTFTPLYTTSFTTESKITSIPLIKISQYEHNVDDILELSLLNCDSSDQVTWYYDGTQLQTDKVTLIGKGEHTIKAEVVRGDATYSVSKIINVK